jgi:hypothetical protein
LSVEQIFVRPFKIKRICHRLSQHRVLELLPAGIENKGLHAGRAGEWRTSSSFTRPALRAGKSYPVAQTSDAFSFRMSYRLT